MNNSAIFNNREIATGLWLIPPLIWLMSNKGMRASIWGVITGFFQRTIIKPVLLSVLYITSVTYLLWELSLWDVNLIKDTVVWVVGSGVVLLLNSNDAMREEKHFTKIIIDSLRLVIIIEFLINLYSFHLIIELILLPFIFLLTMINKVSETNENSMPAKRFTESILAVIGLVVGYYTLVMVISDFHNFVSIHNLRAILLPILLTIAFLPFLYFITLYMTYEAYFNSMKYILKDDKDLLRFAKLRMIRMCNFSLGKVKKLSSKAAPGLRKASNKDDVIKLIDSILLNKEVKQKAIVPKTIPESTFKELGSSPVHVFHDLDALELGLAGEINGPGPVEVEILERKEVGGRNAYKIRYRSIEGWIMGSSFDE